MMDLTIKNIFVERIRQGHRLVSEEDVMERFRVRHLSEGDQVNLLDNRGKWVARMLVGRQNKGLGWIFTLDSQEAWSDTLIRDRFNQAMSKRWQQFDHAQTNAFRLINGEGDGLGGMTLDYYKGYLVLNWYSRGVYTYRELFIQAIEGANYPFKGLYETKRFPLEANEVAILHTWGQGAPQPLTVLENGVSFAVYLGQDWMTGIFLDQREVRHFVQTQAKGLSLLNLFSYTGAFSVAGAVGGAKQTVSVDVAGRSLERTREQFALNHIEVQLHHHQIRVMDVFDYLRYAQNHDLTFDMVICDPPSYARTKKRQFSAEQDYQALAAQLFALTTVGGLTLMATNHAAYNKDRFLADIMQAGKGFGGAVQFIQSFDLPEDFPTTADPASRYLKVFVFYRVK